MSPHPSPSPVYARFIESMNITYMMWHDGEGYDVAAFKEMTPDERTAIEALLIERLSGNADWRDIEALEYLDTPTAVAAINKARTHRNAEVRKHALQHFLDNPPASVPAGAPPPPTPEQLDAEVARAVAQGAIDMAQDHPTPAVKKALLDLSRLGDKIQRVNAAAMLMYICGHATAPFDWEQRPFFLRFNDEGHDLYLVWHELKARCEL